MRVFAAGRRRNRQRRSSSRVSIAYTDVGAYGDNIVGFQLGLHLPDMCFKCGKPPAPTRVGLPITAQRDLAWRLAAAGEGRNDWLSAPSQEKLLLELPYCDDCARRRVLARRLRIAAYLSPIVVILATVGVGSVAKSLTLAAFGAFGLAAIVLSITSGVLRRRTSLRIERLDEDGVIRIAGVDYETAQAIELAATAGGSPPRAGP